MQGETIVALSTPPGESGIAVIRLSGIEAESILVRLSGGTTDWRSHHIRRTNLIDTNGELIDEAMAVLMKGPDSYTGENVVEIYSHGSLQVVSELIETMLALGAVTADPGEFTKRAFLNGRLDLAQAEAVADLIAAETKLQRQVALEHLEGGLSRAVGEIEEQIREQLALVEVSIDFSEEEIPTYDTEVMLLGIASMREVLKRLIESETTGIKLRRGIRITILGARNAGKSSLYNALIGEERAIVSPVPGTTRDLLSERIHIGGFTYHLEDTAGIAETGCEIEAKGISIGRSAAGRADIVIFVMDGSEGLPEGAEEELDRMKGRKILCVLNKKDLGLALDEEEAARLLGVDRVLSLSALCGDGLDELRGWIYDESVTARSVRVGKERVALNARQAAALKRADEALDRLEGGMKGGAPAELLSVELRAAADECGSVTGRSVADDLLDTIFRRFCIGK
jgi:tRNA modification GTPase